MLSWVTHGSSLATHAVLDLPWQQIEPSPSETDGPAFSKGRGLIDPFGPLASRSTPKCFRFAVQDRGEVQDASVAFRRYSRGATRNTRLNALKIGT